MYEMVFTRKSSDFIISLQKGYKEKLKYVLGKLKEDPFSHPYRKIRGETNLYRIRLGKYRLLYEVDEDKERVVILKIDKRSKVYGR